MNTLIAHVVIMPGFGDPELIIGGPTMTEFRVELDADDGLDYDELMSWEGYRRVSEWVTTDYGITATVERVTTS